jgi:hypothetical protein
MNINKIIKMLNTLHLDYQIKHLNDYSELTVKSNSQLNDTYIIFDCIDGEVEEIGIEEK